MFWTNSQVESNAKNSIKINTYMNFQTFLQIIYVVGISCQTAKAIKGDFQAILPQLCLNVKSRGLCPGFGRYYIYCCCLTKILPTYSRLLSLELQFSKATQSVLHRQKGTQSIPDSKVHGPSIGPTWFLSAPGGPHVGPINLAFRDDHDITNHGKTMREFDGYTVAVVIIYSPYHIAMW